MEWWQVFVQPAPGKKPGPARVKVERKASSGANCRILRRPPESDPTENFGESIVRNHPSLSHHSISICRAR